MEYSFPNEGFENEVEQFMLGGKYLVAPVLEKGASVKKIKLPKGKWQFEDKIFDGGQEIEVGADLDILPVLTRL
jgi:alpha-glucosidase